SSVTDDPRLAPVGSGQGEGAPDLEVRRGRLGDRRVAIEGDPYLDRGGDRVRDRPGEASTGGGRGERDGLDVGEEVVAGVFELYIAQRAARRPSDVLGRANPPDLAA